MYYHRARCHVCGQEYLLQTYRNLDFDVRWPDGRIGYSCPGHKADHIREAYTLTFVRGEGLGNSIEV